MTIPVPFACNPGDRLQVIRDRPCGTDLRTGDLVSVLGVGIHVAHGLPVPVVQVSTSQGVQLLTFDAVMPHTDADLPAIKAAEPDDVVDAFFWRMIGNDDELRDWAVKAREELSANDPTPEERDPDGGGTAVKEAHQVGQEYTFIDAGGDEIEVSYYEQGCPDHGREGLFLFEINEEDSVYIPANQIDGLIKYLSVMKKHSERPQGE